MSKRTAKLTVAEGVPVSVDERVAVGVGVGVRDRVDVGEGETVGETEAEMVEEGLGDCDCDGDCDGVLVGVALIHGKLEADESAPGVALTEAAATTQLRNVTDPGVPEPPSVVETPMALPAVNARTRLGFTYELPPPPDAWNEKYPHVPPAPP